MSIEFSRDLITGRIAEVVFEQMMRDMGGYTVIPFGYEHTVPTLTQYRHLAQIPEIIDNIADAPDFVLISEDKTKIFMVEVKYRSTLNREELLNHAHELCKRWKCPWLFVATPDGFFCSMCEHIIEENTIKPLSENWASKDVQEVYLSLMNEFRRKNGGIQSGTGKSKEFDLWNEKKKDVHVHNSRPFYHKREVWWCAMGTNIGNEVNGTGDQYDRPVLVIRPFNAQTFFGVALSGRQKSGAYYFPVGRIAEREAIANLSQVRLYDTKRLLRKIETLDEAIFEALCERLSHVLFPHLFPNNLPRVSGARPKP